jgi:hypothetical protein
MAEARQLRERQHQRDPSNVRRIAVRARWRRLGAAEDDRRNGDALPRWSQRETVGSVNNSKPSARNALAAVGIDVLR